MSAAEASARLRRELQANHDLGEQVQAPGFPQAELERLQSFQRARLGETYADLEASPRYRAAVKFFLSELYGGLHFMERDQQVQRALPLLTRMLPGHMQETLADAFRLQELSLDLDMRMTRAWLQGLAGSPPPAIDAKVYQALYPAIARPLREEQIQLIYDLGLELNQLLKHRLVLVLLKAMRRPARAAGFGALQTFLEDGFGAFDAIGDSSGFVTTIRDRETVIMNRLYGGLEQPFNWQG
jgi:hypothetical protein